MHVIGAIPATATRRESRMFEAPEDVRGRRVGVGVYEVVFDAEP